MTRKDKIKDIRDRSDYKIEELQAQIERIKVARDFAIRKIQDECVHEDDGGMFYATCKHCGYG